MNDEQLRGRPDKSTAGAWAAAAVVLALGALLFGVLAHIRITDLENRISSLEARTADGEVVTTDATLPTVVTTGVPVTQGEQPVDTEAARADVIAAFTAVYDSRNGLDARLARIDDPTGVAVAIRQVEAGPNAALVDSATVNVNDVQFTSPSRATVIYGVTVPGQPPALGRTGEARVTAGTWKVTRATVCGDLQAVGATC